MLVLFWNENCSAVFDLKISALSFTNPGGSLPALTCLSVSRCCSCCCRFHWLCWMSSSMEGVAGGGIGGGAMMDMGGGGTSTTSLAPGLYISATQNSGEGESLMEGWQSLDVRAAIQRLNVVQVLRLYSRPERKMYLLGISCKGEINVIFADATQALSDLKDLKRSNKM